MHTGMTSSGLPTNREHSFVKVPGVDRPRSTFERTSTHKTTFPSGYLIPIYTDEVLPGDTHQVSANIFGRLLSTLKFPIYDNMYMDWIAIFGANRILWDKFVRQMGQRNSPADSIDFLTPLVTHPTGGWGLHSLGDFFEVATGKDIDVTAYLFRMYNKFYNQLVKDQNLIDAIPENQGDGPDADTDYVLRRRMKRLDYFTGCLPFAQKGTAPSINIGTTAPVVFPGGGGSTIEVLGTSWEDPIGTHHANTQMDVNGFFVEAGGTASSGPNMYLRSSGDLAGMTGVYANLAAVSGITLNQFRLLATTQQILELDARGGTRYNENMFSHFGVVNPDARVQRIEFLGAGTVPLNVHPVAQTSESATTPQGTLAAFTSMSGNVNFSHSFTEHGHIMVLVQVRADLTYQQGTRRMFFRRTRYDYYWPSFANIGEQAVLNREIYTQAGSADTDTFGYQEYAAEYRYKPSSITGLFRSTATGTLDFKHLSQKFTALPTLGQTFIEDNPPLSRVVVDTAQPFIEFDSFFRNKTTRVMPVFSVPGLTRI